MVFQRQRRAADRLNNSPRRAYDLLRSTLAARANAYLVEGELIESLSASRNTVRVVLQQLAREGLVTREPKNGTRSVAPLLLPVDRISSVAEFAPPPAQVETRVREFQHLGCPPLVRDRMALEDGWRVLMIESLLFKDGSPLALSVCYVALDAGEVVRLEGTEPDPIVILETQLGVSLRGGRTTVSAVAADEQSAELLEVDVHAPLIWLEDVIEDDRGRPRALSQFRLRPDRVAFRADARRLA